MTIATRYRPNLTFAMIKSDAFANGVAAQILADIQAKGYHILHGRILPEMNDLLVNRFYADHRERAYFPDLKRSVSGRVYPMLLEKPTTAFGVDPISEFRSFIGKTNAREADADSLRGKYGAHLFDPDAPLAFNAIHGSDSPANMVNEFQIMFGHGWHRIGTFSGPGSYNLLDYPQN